MTRVKLTVKQAKFMQSSKRGCVFLGGLGSGKSRILCYKALVGALNGRRSVLCSFSYTNLRDVLTHTMFEALDAHGLEVYKHFVFHKVDNFFEIMGKGGSTQILMRSGDEPDRLRGINLDDFYLDECRQFPDRTIFDVLIGRIRNREDAQWGLCSTTAGKNWTYDLIEQEGLTKAFETGEAESDNMTVLIQSSFENTFLPKSYLAELSRQYTGNFAQQELYARIVDFSAGVFRRDWFQNRDLYYKPTEGVRYWDLASSTKTAADFSVGVLIAKKDGIYNVVDVIRKKAIYPELREMIVNTAVADGPNVVIGVEQVGMQAVVVQDLCADKRLAGYKIKAHKPTRDKLSRALPLTSRFEQQVLRLCAGAWNDKYIDEMCQFDGSELSHDDQVDGTSGAWELICRPALFKAVQDGVCVMSDEDKPALQRLAAVEILDFRAYIVRFTWHPHKEILQVLDEGMYDTIDGMVDFLKNCQHRVGNPLLESDSFKSINQALMNKLCPVMPQEDLDLAGGVYTLNQMILKSQVFIPKGLKVYGEVAGADTTEELPPYALCLLRIVQEIRSWKKEKVKEYMPFERQREAAKKAYQLAMKPESKEWV